MIRTVGSLVDAINTLPSSANQTLLLEVMDHDGRNPKYVYCRDVFIDHDGDLIIQVKLDF